MKRSLTRTYPEYSFNMF